MNGNSRRSFLQGAALAALAGPLPLPATLARAATSAPREGRDVAVGAVFNEQLYVDRSGRVAAYRPPVGARGLAAIAHLDETAIRMAHPYL